LAKYSRFIETWGLTSTPGIKEYWNDGIMGFQRILSIFLSIVSLDDRFPIIACSQDPFFQYSSIPSFQLGRTPGLASLKARLVRIYNKI
jgi:hypothetical protein